MLSCKMCFFTCLFSYFSLFIIIFALQFFSYFGIETSLRHTRVTQVCVNVYVYIIFLRTLVAILNPAGQLVNDASVMPITLGQN